MPIAHSLIPEFSRELVTTRALLERIPDDRAAWAPHAKSKCLGDLAAHITDLVSLIATTIAETQYDLDPPGPATSPRPAESTDTRLARFDDGVRRGLGALAVAPDETMLATWSLARHGAPVLALPRIAVLRTVVMNHLIHHRGQLSVYLRMNDVPLPPMYGPTADEPFSP